MMQDITLPHVGGFYWWDDEPPKVSFVKEETYTIGYLFMSLHSGTHIDLPLHVGINLAVNIAHSYEVKVVDLLNLSNTSLDDTSFDGILLKTGQGKYLKDGTIEQTYIALSTEQAEYIMNCCRLKIIGIEAPSIEHYNGDGTVHRMFLSQGIPILENIDLTDVSVGNYKLFLFPLKVSTPVDALPTIAKLAKLRRE